MISSDALRIRLAERLVGLQSPADLDISVVVGDQAPVNVRFNGSGAALVDSPDPERTVVLRVTPAGAEAVLAGTANAQMLLASGALKVGGRIDVLQAQAAALSALGDEPSA